MKSILWSMSFGLSSLVAVGLYTPPVRANEMALLNQYMIQVEKNQSWADASFPIENFQGYLSTYGDFSTPNGIQVFNRGIGLESKAGSYVRSWLTGRVEQILQDDYCGVSVVIQSGPWRHVYCHMKGEVRVNAAGKPMLVDQASGIQIQEGQVVQVGERLAQVRTQPGVKPQLYWQVQYEAQWVDPAIVLNLMHAQQARRNTASQPQQQPQQPNQQPAQQTPRSNQTTAGTIPPQIVALRRAIIGQESNNNFRAVNPHSGALGYGQVMPFNVGPWSREALGYTLTDQQFLNSPELQLKIIEFKLTQYWRSAMRRSGGDESIAVRMVASQWYSGDPTLYNNTRPQPYNGHEYPSINNYTLSVLAKYHSYRGVSSTN